MEEFLEIIFNRQQIGLETSMFAILFLILFIYCITFIKCHIINQNWDRSYKDSLDWIKNKNTTINPINEKDNKCFVNDVTVALNYEEIKKDLQRITKIKSFINEYKKVIGKRWLEKNAKNKQLIKIMVALNVLYTKNEKMYPTYISKHNSNWENDLSF